MGNSKITAGQPFPAITVEKLGGGQIDLAPPATAEAPFNWRLIIVYRGKHCPFCTEYLTELKQHAEAFKAQGIDVVAISADTKERALLQIPDIDPNYDVGYNLSIENMRLLGLYISSPRSELESDRPFAEPAMFVINHKGEAQIIDISNIAFARPELKTLLRGLEYIRVPGKNYPPRGTFE